MDELLKSLTGAFAGVGSLTTNLTNVSFTGGSGTRVVVSAPSMSDGGGSWSGVTCNGTGLSKELGSDFI